VNLKKGVDFDYVSGDKRCLWRDFSPTR
jgi:hypothetical protein